MSPPWVRNWPGAMRSRVHLAAVLFCVAVLASLLALSCEDKSIIVSAGDAVVDPRIAPRVLSTFPPVNSVGPYSEWEPESPLLPQAWMEVQFSKVMDLSSVVHGLHLSSSQRDLQIDSQSVIDINREAFMFVAKGMTFPDFHIGEVITLSLSQQVADVNGNMIAPGIIGSFTPEPLFRVRRSSPPTTTILTADTVQFVTLVFNSRVDSSILPYVTFTPSVKTEKQLSADSTMVFVFVTLAEPVQHYWLTVAAGAPDKNGHRLVNGYTSQFSGTPYELALRSTSTTNVPLYKTFILTSEQVMDTSTFRSAFHITPTVAGGMTFTYKKGFMRLRSSVEYAPETDYTIRVDSGLRNADGYRLSKEFALAFRTAAFGVTGSIPADQAVGVSRTNGMAVYFSARLDTSTIRNSFTSVPPFGELTFSSGAPSFVDVSPGDTLLPYQTYVVTVDTTIRSLSGYAMSQPYTFSFTTGGN